MNKERKDYLDKFLEKDFIPHNRIKNKSVISIEYRKIEALNLSAAETDYVLNYLKEKKIKIINKLSEQIEKKNEELFKEYQKNKTIEIRNKIVENNIKLLETFSWKYSLAMDFDQDEVTQIASIGLIKAVEAYNPEIGTKFSSFAWNSMLMNVRNVLYHNSEYFTRQVKNYFQIKKDFEEIGLPITEGNRDNVKEFISYLKENNLTDLDEEILYKGIFKENPESFSKLYGYFLDREELQIEENNPLDCLITQEDYVESSISRRQILDIIKNGLENLDDIKKQIIYDRFGLNGHDSSSLRKIGKKINYSPEGVRILQNKALSELREDKHIKQLKYFL